MYLATYAYQTIELDLETRTLSNGDASVVLRPKECQLLVLFMERPGEILSHDFIYDKGWGYSYVDSNTLPVHIAHLRRKLEKIGIYGIIKAESGEGYIFGEKETANAKA